MIDKNIIIKTLLISLPTLASGTLLTASYLHKPESINLNRDEYLNAMKNTKTWSEKDTRNLLDKLEEFNKDLCKTYKILYTIVPTEEAISQVKTVDQIPQLYLYRQLTTELEKKEWNILPIIIAVSSTYTYPLFVEVDPTNTSNMKIRSVYSEPWLANLLWNMRVYTQILPKCEKYYDNKTIETFKISAEPPPEHKSDSNNDNQQQNISTNNNNNINSNNNSSNISNSNNTNNSNTNQTIITKKTIENKDNFDEEFKKRQEEFEKERKEFEKKLDEEWKKIEEEFNNQQQHH